MKKLPALAALLVAGLPFYSQIFVLAAPPQGTMVITHRTGVAATPTPLPKYTNAAKGPRVTEREMLEALNASQLNANSLVKPPRTTKLDPNDPGNGTTEVSAKVGAFDQKLHMATFTQDVYVESPQFTVNCDKLTCFMHDPANKPADAAALPTKSGETPGATPSATPAPVATPAPAAEAKAGDATAKSGKPAVQPVKSTGGLEKAICEGSVVIIQDKIDQDGTVTRNIGHAAKATYFADSGDMYLTGNPDVKQGMNSCVALDDSTVMIMNRDGHMTINGLHRTVIKDSGSDTNNEPPGQ